MKKVFALILTLSLLTLALTACEGKTTVTTTTATEAPAEATAEPTVEATAEPEATEAAD